MDHPLNGNLRSSPGTSSEARLRRLFLFVSSCSFVSSLLRGSRWRRRVCTPVECSFGEMGGGLIGVAIVKVCFKWFSGFIEVVWGWRYDRDRLSTNYLRLRSFVSISIDVKGKKNQLRSRHGSIKFIDIYPERTRRYFVFHELQDFPRTVLRSAYFIDQTL